MNPKITFLLCSCLCALPASAATLVSDSFDYALGTSLGGQNSGAGFSSAYFASPPVIAAPNLSFGAYPSSGNAAYIPSFRSLDRSSAVVPATGSAFYMSFLLRQENGPSAADDFANLQLHGGSFQNTLQLILSSTGPAGNGDVFSSVSIYGDSAAGSSVEGGHPQPLPRDEAFLYVFKISNWNGGSAGTPQDIQLSIFDEAAYGSLAFPAQDSDLESPNVRLVKLSYPAPFFPASSFNLTFSNFDSALTFDEFRVGTSLADVLPSPVPEPQHVAGVTSVLLGIFAIYRTRTKARLAA